jgi:hypothetical protein
VSDYFSFEDVMRELELGEEELKRMVSEGELRAFRDENKMKFKKEDVDSLKKGRITEPTIILPSTPTSETTDETVLDLDIGQETAALSDTSAQLAAAKPKGHGKPPKKEEEDLVIQSAEVGGDQEETFIEEETDTGLSTEPLKLADEAADETVEAEAVTEPVAEPARLAGRAAGSRVGRRVTAKIPVAVEEEIERKRAHPIWTLLIFLAFIVSAYSGLFFYDMVRLEMGKSDQPSNLTAGFGKWVLDKFWEDGKWRAFHEKGFPEGKKPPFEDAGDLRIKHRSYDGPTFLEGSAPPPPAAGGGQP